MGNKDNAKRKRSHKRAFCGNRFRRTNLSSEDQDQAPLTSTPSSLFRPSSSSSSPNEVADNFPSATAKKLKLDTPTCFSPQKRNTDAEAYLLINMSILQDILNLVGMCIKCSGKLSIENDLSLKKGFACLIRIKCSDCNWMHEFFSSSTILDANKRGPKSFEVNTRMVVAFREIGQGLSGLQSFTRCMNMPNCITQASYDSINKSLQRSYGEVAQASQKKAALETRKSFASAESEQTVDCNVSVDGSWQRRGYSSINGVVTLMSNDNGKCIDTCVLSKACKGCQHWKGKEDSEGYIEWKNNHKCQINHKGSAGAMEVAGAIEMFKRSIAFHNLRYAGYIGDGDTKAHQSVVAASPYDNMEIKKLECIGHVQKRLGTRLRSLLREKKGQKLSDGKLLSGKNRLTKKIINAMQTYYGMAIRQNVNSLYQMKKAVVAILFHCSENVNMEECHKFCPRTAKSWCKFQADKVTNKTTYKPNITIPVAIKGELMQVFKDLSSDDLLAKCLHGQTQNVNEALHRVIWQKCPKAVYTSRNVIEIATASAVINFNDGAHGIEKVMKRLGIAPGKFMVRHGRKKNLQRMNDSLKKASSAGKQRRKKLRSVKKGYEDKEKEEEGEIYKSGGY